MGDRLETPDAADKPKPGSLGENVSQADERNTLFMGTKPSLRALPENFLLY